MELIKKNSVAWGRPAARKLPGMLAGLAVVLALAACGPEGAPDAAGGVDADADPAEGAIGSDDVDPIVIGHLASITGELAGTGAYTKRGFDMAVAEINEAGGINGRQLEVAEYDTGADAPTAVSALQRLLQDEPVAIMGPIWDHQHLAWAQTIENEEVPIFYSAGNESLSAQDNPWMFGLHPSDKLAAEALVDFAAEELGISRLAVQHIALEYGSEAASAIEARAQERVDVEVVSTESHGPGDRDVSAQLGSHLQGDPEGLIAWTFPADQAVIMRQTAEMDFPGAHLGVTAAVLPDTLDLVADEDAEGWYGEVAAFLIGNDDPEVVDWVERYQQEYGADVQPTAFDAIAYDGTYIMAAAMEDALGAVGDGDLTELRDAVRENIANTTYEGVDTYYEFDEDGRGPHEVVFVQIGASKSLELVTRVGQQAR